ncbi:hypothetical protein LZ016_03220 [Sphingomonas sp. SM33]|uniref:Uncharacterized protein n=1 Tax=Sphingomonas telluris TaxID=2907998 RepID=A0ABS9VJG2_9SPHN|nr:hypothetical protein [Sphingomonas telluris]MCH8615118.1 hypothetical protein [Sphingomonas telluris]
MRSLPDHWANRLRPLWMVLFGLAVLTVMVSTIYAVRASYYTQPVIHEFGLDFDVTTSSELLVGTYAPQGETPTVPLKNKVVSIDGNPVPADLQVSQLAKRLDKAEGNPVKVVLRQPDGKLIELSQERHKVAISPADLNERNFRIWTRLATALFACVALLACGMLLALRRPNDPVAMLLAFAFIAMVAVGDPPMQFWLWTGKHYVIDIFGSVFFYLLLVGLAAFPDGVFVPRALRWLIPVGIPLAIFVSSPAVNEDLQGVVAIGGLFAVLACQVIRFRREPVGIVRQQIKWAGFGFAAGLLLVLAAVVLAAAIGDQSNFTPLMSLAVLVLFSLGLATMALGLIVALIRFRLWEADTVITRSAAYAVVTLIVGVVWAASSDLVKLVITEVMGHDSEAGATTVGAIIAAGVFSPTQSAVLGWTRKHFGGPLDQIHDSAKRLKSWGLTESPEEVATRALSIIDQAAHPAASAIVLDTAMGHELIAAREVTSADDSKLIEKLTIEDEESSVGTLLIGRRSDGNRYNKQEIEAIREIIPSLAEALRVARGRFSRESAMQQRMEEMAARLAQLEGGTPKPA